MKIRLLVLVVFAVLATVPAILAEPISAARQDEPVWQNALIWQASLADAGTAVAEHVNQISASCNVDIDPVLAANGQGPEGSVYAFSVSWSCPAVAEPSTQTWQGALFWYPSLAEAGAALADQLNRIDAACSVDVDTVVPAAGVGPEGPVYAFAVAWAC